MSTESTSKTITLQPQRLPLGMSVLLIVVVVLGMAGISYGLRQYSIRNDEKIGEEKRKKQEASETPEGRRQQQLEETRIMAKQLEDSLARSADTSLYIPIGNMRYNIGDTEGALKMYESYVTTVNPDNLSAKTDYGYILFSTGRHEDGIRVTREVLKKQPTNQIALYNMGFMLYEGKQYEDALRWMHLAVNADTSSEIGKQAQFAFEEFKRKADSVKAITK